MVAACQFVYEEKFIRKYNIPALKVVGLEGKKQAWARLASFDRNETELEVIDTLSRTKTTIILQTAMS